MITSEHSLQDAEEEATPHHPSPGRVPVLRDEDVLSTQLAGQNVTLTSMAGEEVAQTALPESRSALPELPTAQVEIEVETRQISQPEVAAEVSDDAGSIRAEADSAVVMVNNGPSVYPMVEEVEPSCSMPFVGLRTDQVGPTVVSTYDSIWFFRPTREYEYDKASLEECLAGPIIDVIRALTSANYLGQSTAGCIPTEDMIDALVRLQTMVSLF
jgi:hypothetical protein